MKRQYKTALRKERCFVLPIKISKAILMNQAEDDYSLMLDMRAH